MFKNNFLTAFLLMAAIVFGTGCTSGVRQIDRYIPSINYNEETIQNYKIGDTKKIYIGENIIEKGRIVYEEITSGKFMAITEINNCYRKNHVYNIIYIDRQDKSFYVGCVEGDFSGGLKVDSNGILLDSHGYYNNPAWGGWQNLAMAKEIGKVGTKLFKPLDNTAKASKGSFKMEIIYSGLDEDSLKAIYREYKDDIARPAFYQELVYNLNKSDIIRYKNFKIKIINATNEELEYIVIED